MWYVYILECKDGTHYKGLTADVERRIKQHNLGQCKSTKYRKPCYLIYKEECKSRIEARLKEKYYKSGQGRDEIKKIVAGVAELADAQS